METVMLSADERGVQTAADALRDGQLVAFPTETVYGLGADALNEQAVRAIFAAKERPCDNPLIVHIFDGSQLAPLCRVNAAARALIDAFWPGPLTLILPKTPAVPDCVTAGLASVAVRMPSHPVARALLSACKLPVAAPSANRSGRPSPTTARHVMDDLNGRIPYILDGGACDVGLESTVLDITDERAPVVLRPGGISPDMLRRVLPNVSVAGSVLRPLAEGEAAPSPGMKHKHYAPKGRMTLVCGADAQTVARAICARYDGEESACVLAFTKHLGYYGNRNVRDLGKDAEEAARRLFSLLRDMDDAGVPRIFAEGMPPEGVGLALMNRMTRAAGFDVVTV